MSTEEQSCRTCRFWAPSDRMREYDNHEDACRRHAPHARLVLNLSQYGGSPTPEWPVTRAVDWCGDWAKFNPVRAGETS